jgi:aspartate kinase
MNGQIVVIKIGGSVLTGADAYHNAATIIAERIATAPEERVIAVVSAESGTTDALLAMARAIGEDPDPGVVDLLWSTGEIRSVALLTLCLHALGVRAAAANVHQTGLTRFAARASRAALTSLRLRALMAEHRVVVVPGFLARSGGDRIASLGRGGSDLTAILVAAGLQAARCELLKDVAGYFTADPKDVPDARLLPWLSYSHALSMADDGCELVQRAALEAARDHGIELVISNACGRPGTRVSANPHLPGSCS